MLFSKNELMPSSVANRIADDALLHLLETLLLILRSDAIFNVADMIANPAHSKQHFDLPLTIK